MKDWFGKGCKYLSVQWEDNETTDGPSYQDYKPVLVFCAHPDNASDYEGNCNPTLCPIKIQNE